VGEGLRRAAFEVRLRCLKPSVLPKMSVARQDLVQLPLVLIEHLRSDLGFIQAVDELLGRVAEGSETPKQEIETLPRHRWRERSDSSFGHGVSSILR
jgi:hypothetical protein